MLESLNLNRFVIPAFFVIGAVIYYLLKREKGSMHLNLKSTGSGTPYLDMYCMDFTMRARQGKLDPVIGRTTEVQKLAQVLSRRSKNNAILVGSPGVGKTAIIEGLAQRIVAGEVPESLLNKRLLALDVATLMSGTKYRGEFEERAKKIVHEIEVSQRTIILFIDEIHSVIQSQGSEGAINFSDILKPALARGDLQMVGATTTPEYEKYIKNDSSLERRFQVVEVSEPTVDETLQILQGVKNKYQEYHKVEFTDAAINAAAVLSDKLIKDRKLPDKAIDLIDEAGSMVKVSHIHTDVPMVLYESVKQNHPESVELWNKIQNLEKATDAESIKEREQLEKQLESLGVITVDEDDIKKIVDEWAK